MKWLEQWRGAKSAPAPTGVASRRVPDWLTGGGAVGGPARGYDARLEAAVLNNPVGHRAVKLISGAVGGLTVEAIGEAGEAAAALVGAEGFLETVAMHVLLHGNAYVQAVPGADDAPQQLVALRPERVSVLTDGAGWPTGFAYRIGSKTQRIAAKDALERQQVVHIRACHPRDDHYGLGSLDAAIAPASVHNAAARWNQALLDNAARPSGALVHRSEDGTPLTDQQFARLKAELTSQYEGAGNAGRPLLLEGDLDWRAFSLTPADMDFVKLKEAAARDIALAFGVPPVLLGLPGDATYANGREAGRALYRQTVLPLAKKILRGVETMLSDWIEPVRFVIDEDQLSELMEDRSRLWTALNDADFLTDGEKRAMLGFPAERPE
ncbi:phage portal protein [Sphingomicrobium sp. XHP0239]|uniref:phage portal protein n=1 Tax=Sphingomicrobium maritimum TaxID=3133972 RepID=UPI0031CC73C5